MRKCEHERSPSHWRWLTVILLVLGLAFASTASAQTCNPIRIMPLGASIVQGINGYGEGGFRRPLYQMLIGAGYSVDFVGSLHDCSTGDFDPDHEGHSGLRADEIRDNITEWLDFYPADVVLLLIGTNDISQNQGAAGTAAEIGQILDRIDAWETTHNQVWVVLARIINRNDDWSDETTTLNGLIQNLADARIAAGDRIIVVDMEGALIYPDDLADAVHPNDTGYGKMATAWYDKLLIVLTLDRDGDCDVDGTDLAALIANPVRPDITIFAQNFGRNTRP